MRTPAPAATPTPVRRARPAGRRVGTAFGAAVAGAALATAAAMPVTPSAAAAVDRPPLPTQTAKRGASPTYLLYGGDWNARPATKGKYSPSWVAKQSKMKIVAPPPIPGGTRYMKAIDYTMSNAAVHNMRRVDGGGSDHTFTQFIVKNPRTGATLRGATWNVLRKRDAASTRAMITFLNNVTSREDLDFVLLQEIHPFPDELRGVTGFTLAAPTSPAGADHNGILVRNDHSVTKVSAKQMSSKGWKTVDGKWHVPTTTTSATIDGWLRAVTVHECVSLKWVDGRMTGPPRRMADRSSSAANLVAMAARNRAEAAAWARRHR